MAENPEEIDSSPSPEVGEAELPNSIPVDNLQEMFVKALLERSRIVVDKPENSSDRQSRLNDARHERWRKTITALVLKPLLLFFLLGVLAYCATVLAGPDLSPDAKEVAKDAMILIVGTLVGFAAGKADP